MNQYRVISQNGWHTVQVGQLIPSFYLGSPPIQWTTLTTTHTIEEANAFIDFHKKSTAGSYYLQRSYI